MHFDGVRANLGELVKDRPLFQDDGCCYEDGSDGWEDTSVLETVSRFLSLDILWSVVALDALLNSARINAIVGWATVGVMVIGAVESFLTNAVLWGGFSLLLVAVASLPALTTGDWMAMVPWPLLFGAAVAVIVRAIELFSETAGYLAIATFALLMVVELDVFTPVELGRRFAVVFGVLTTMAIETLWIIVQFYSDQWLGTEFLSTQTELQEDIVIVTVVGFVLGGFFFWFFDRFDPAGIREQSSNPG
jgi:hypothetical protein